MISVIMRVLLGIGVSAAVAYAVRRERRRAHEYSTSSSSPEYNTRNRTQSESKICEICLKPLENKDITKIQCSKGLGHSYHFSCISEVFRNEVIPMCPVCRVPCRS